jgi:uncharacterized membrane protein YbaN (DUF454 family)
MKSFVRVKENHRWIFILIGVLAVVIVFLGNTVSELVYLPLLLLYAFQEARGHFRQRGDRRAKALLGGARSTGSR